MWIPPYDFSSACPHPIACACIDKHHHQPPPPPPPPPVFWVKAMTVWPIPPPLSELLDLCMESMVG